MIQNKDIEIFFKEMVISSRLSSSVSPEGRLYVVHLLSDLSSKSLDGGSIVIRVLSFGDIMELKEAGDEALFISGFFPEKLNKQGTTIQFYGSMGSAAYAELSGRFSPNMRPVFSELSRNFEKFRKIIFDVRKRCPGLSESSLKW